MGVTYTRASAAPRGSAPERLSSALRRHVQQGGGSIAVVPPKAISTYRRGSRTAQTGAHARREFVRTTKGAMDFSALIPHPIPARSASSVPPPRRRGFTLAPSALRPHVKASNRFLVWRSQYSIVRDAQNARTLPSADARQARFDAILQSVESKTRETYSAGLLRFHEFCDAQHVPEAQRMPASDFLLSAFVAHHAGRVGKSCVDNWLAGLQLWHNLHDAPWFGARALAAASKGVHKRAPAASSRARRAPVTVEHMRRLNEQLDLSDSFDAAVYGAALVAFRGCCRLGEVVVHSESSFDRARHVARGARIVHGTSVSGVLFRKIQLPWSKTTGTAGAEVILSASRDNICPVAALDNHLTVNAGAPPNAPLFAWKDKHGSWCPLTRVWLLKRCAAVWASCGLAAVQGHSFRIGGATDLLLRGVQPAVVAVQGRWRSRAFLQYWRSVESVLPDFIDRASPSVTVESISAAVARMESDIA